MTDREVVRYANLTIDQLRRRLNAREAAGQIPSATRLRILNYYMKEHKEKMMAKRRLSRVRHAWAVLIRQVAYELNSSVTAWRRFNLMDRQAETEAYRAYIDVLTRMDVKFHRARDGTAPFTEPVPPGKLRLEFKRQGKPILFDGKHWSDWVDADTRARVTALFAAIPPRPKTRVKVPFNRRTLPPSTHRGGPKAIFKKK